MVGEGGAVRARRGESKSSVCWGSFSVAKCHVPTTKKKKNLMVSHRCAFPASAAEIQLLALRHPRAQWHFLRAARDRAAPRRVPRRRSCKSQLLVKKSARAHHVISGSCGRVPHCWGGEYLRARRDPARPAAGGACLKRRRPGLGRCPCARPGPRGARAAARARGVGRRAGAQGRRPRARTAKQAPLFHPPTLPTPAPRARRARRQEWAFFRRDCGKRGEGGRRGCRRGGRGGR